jgi:hypothetical protein
LARNSIPPANAPINICNANSILHFQNL